MTIMIICVPCLLPFNLKSEIANLKLTKQVFHIFPAQGFYK
jgi:hypothetical protein